MSDENERRPASENPWYILMTIAGEQGEDYDGDLYAKNRRYWHGWLAQGLGAEAKADLISREVLSEEDLAPFNADEQTFWEAQIMDRGQTELPDQNDTIGFSHCDFETFFSCDSFYFSGYAFFGSAAFSGNADFRKAVFFGNAHIESSTFCKRTYFSETFFHSKINFSDAVFQKRTTFHHAKFDREAPRFFGSNLHEDTDWTNASWPKGFLQDPDAKSQYKGQTPTERRRAYERLKLLMDSQKKTHDEQMFHRLELQCREVEEGFPANIPSRLYGLVSDYGWSFMRPALGLGAVILCGFLWIAAWLAHEGRCPGVLELGTRTQDCGWTILSLSLSNTFGFLGLGRSVLRDELDAFDDLGWFEIGAGAQFFLGPILLFFLFLALRNRYRMR